MSITLVNCVLLDGTGAEPLEDAAIVIDGERIVAVGRSASVVTRSTERVIDLQGQPVAGATVRVDGELFVPARVELENWLRAVAANKREVVNVSVSVPGGMSISARRRQ